MKRSLLLATVFGALCFPAFADPAPMAVGSNAGVEHPSPIAGGEPIQPIKTTVGAHGFRPTPRMGDPRVEAARRAAESRKIKSEQK